MVVARPPRATHMSRTETRRKLVSDDSAFQFAGRENDGASNLYYYRARYYSPQLARFISQDPIGFDGGLNWYAYANGNPISLRDPSGKDPLVVIGAIIAGVAGAVQAANSGGGWNEGNALIFSAARLRVLP